MDSFETLGGLCSGKFDSIAKFGEGSRVDTVYGNTTRKEVDSQKPVKYFTQNPSQLVGGTNIGPRGLSVFQGPGTPSCSISKENDIRRGFTGFLSRNKQELRSLPMATSPGLYKGTVNVDVEDNIRGGDLKQKKSCNPKDNTFYDRSFYIFDNLSVKPYGFFADRNLSGSETRSMLKTTTKK
jgi:hypothetical protein